MKLTVFECSFCLRLVASYIWIILDVQNYKEIILIGNYKGHVRKLLQYMLKYKIYMLKMMLSNNIFD